MLFQSDKIRRSLSFCGEASSYKLQAVLSPRTVAIVVHILFCVFGISLVLLQPIPNIVKLELAVFSTAFALTVIVILSHVTNVADFLRPFGWATLFFYVAYYSQALFYVMRPGYLYADSPDGPVLFGVSAYDICRALGLSTAGFIAFALGGWGFHIHARLRTQYDRRPPRRKLCPRELDVWRFIFVLTLVAIVVRLVAVSVFGVNASIGEPKRIAGIPFLAGFLNLETLWGGRLILALTFTVAVVSGKPARMAGAILACLLFGLFSSAVTGSKSEILIPFVIIAIICLVTWRQIRPAAKWGLVSLGLLFVILYLSIYPVLHSYRYVRSDISFLSHLNRTKEAFSLPQGAAQVYVRLTGIEGLSNILAYERAFSTLPKGPSVKYCYTYEICNIGYETGIGMSCGLFGALYLRGGVFLMLLGGVLLGFLTALLGRSLPITKDQESTFWSLNVAAMATLTMLLTRLLMCSGVPFLDLKHVFCFVLTYMLLRRGLQLLGSRGVPRSFSHFSEVDHYGTCAYGRR